MPRRSRSRSPRRDRDRGRDRSRDRDRRDRDRGGRRDYDPRGDRDRDERLRDDRSRGERFSRRSRSPVDRFRAAPGSSSTTTSKPLKEEKKRFSAADFAGKSEEEIEMMKCMGFGGFDTTKGKKVDGNDVGAVHVKLKRTYRQYMNRRGGFNRPLDAVH